MSDTFRALGVSEPVEQALAARGITEPFRIQTLVLPDALEGRDILAKAMEMASPLLEQRRHRVEIRDSSPGLRVLADEARLAQVVANLLTNAAKYTEPGGHVLLATWREGQDAVIEVRDDGMGIAPDLLPRVFDLFVQGRQSTERPNGGLGLGLSIVRNLVTMHGGRVQARSGGLGHGSTFTVRLPAVDGEVCIAKPRRPVVAPSQDEGQLIHFSCRICPPITN